MPRFISHLVPILLLWSSIAPARAQRLALFNLKVEDGLAQSQATCLTQDKSGNLWIGTFGGISRFDGRKIKNYSVSDGLYSNSIVSIHYARSEKLYCCSAIGVQYFDGDKFKTVYTNKGRILDNITQIEEDDAGTLYMLRNDQQLYQLNDSRDTAEPIRHVHDCTAILAGKQELFCARADGSLSIFRTQKQLTHVQSIKGIPKSYILRLFRDSKNRIWCATTKGVALVNGQQLELFRTRDGIKLEGIAACIGEDNRGSIWLGANNGVVRITDTSLNIIRRKNGLTDNIVYCLLRDAEGNLWMGTDGEGVFRYSGGPFVSLDEANGLLNKQVTGITGNQNGDLFFCGYMGRAIRYHLKTGVSESLPMDRLEDAVVQHLVWQPGKGLWMGTRGRGLLLFRGKAQPYRSRNGIHPTDIYCLHQGPDSTIYAGYPGGILCIKDNNDRNIPMSGTFPKCLATEGKDSLFVATNLGLKLFVKGEEIVFSVPKEIEHTDIQCMVYRKGNLFLGSAEKGVIVYNIRKGSTSVLNSKNGMSSDFIYTLTDDGKGNIWAGTGRGICRINTNSSPFGIQVYRKGNGIIGLENNTNAAYADPSGLLWFGTTEGISCYLPNAQPVKPKVQSIVLESVSLLGGRNIDDQYFSGRAGWYNIPQDLQLPYRYNNLSFTFQAVTMSPSENIQYRYTLEGRDIYLSEWIDVNTINFSSLEPGNYKLKITCKIDGVLQDAALNYTFSIKTPFHKSIWFIVSIIGMAILSGVCLQYAANRRKQKRQQREAILRKEEQNKIRERTAEDFHDEVGNRLTRINLLANVLKTKLPADNKDAQRILQQIQDNSLQLYAGTRDILWSLQTSNDNLYEIIHHIKDLALELLSESNIAFSLSGNEESFRDIKMPLDKSRNFIMIWKEALSNCVKYADANRVLFQIQRQSDDSIQFRLADDGKGFDIQERSGGNGLKNMLARANRLQAQLDILSGPSGTQIILIMKDK